MQIQFLGVGGAFDVPFGNSAALIDCNNKRYLVDCGHTVFPTLLQKQLIPSIDAVLITHLHDDHVGSLSTLAFYSYFFLQKPLTLLVPDIFFQELVKFLTFSMKEPQKFINFLPLPEFIIAINTFNKHYPDMQTFAYIFSHQQMHLVYSGDINDPNFIFDFIQDTNLQGQIKIFHDLSFFEAAKNAHAFYKDLQKHLSAFEIYGYHNNPTLKPTDCIIPLAAEQNDWTIYY